jgi:hypothetical protein
LRTVDLVAVAVNVVLLGAIAGLVTINNSVESNYVKGTCPQDLIREIYKKDTQNTHKNTHVFDICTCNAYIYMVVNACIETPLLLGSRIRPPSNSIFSLAETEKYRG